jgi:hypothetical protein
MERGVEIGIWRSVLGNVSSNMQRVVCGDSCGGIISNELASQ